MINDFVRIFRKEENDFKEYPNKDELVKILFKILDDDDLFKKVINEIKDNAKSDGNMFANIVSLLPFSVKIIESFLKSDYFESKEATNLIRAVWLTNTKIIDVLEKLKNDIRGQEADSINLEGKLKEVDKELKKQSKSLDMHKELKEKEKKLLGSNIKNLKQLENEINELEKSTKKHSDLSKEINDSMKKFENLPKDDS